MLFIILIIRIIFISLILNNGISKIIYHFIIHLLLFIKMNFLKQNLIHLNLMILITNPVLFHYILLIKVNIINELINFHNLH